MALSSLRLRRTLIGFTTLQRSLSTSSALSAPLSCSSPLLHASTTAQSPASHQQSWTLLLQSRSFRSSSAAFSSARTGSYGRNDNDVIGPDTILFEGCDYNHWLIVMDFSKDNPPSREEMIRTYEETAARGLNISVEEAKKKIYACSTTTYTGFQVLMSEAESEKFEGVPGVIFVLPDSYIDPPNKEYGGDKYINGEIIPRPPPIQYGRQTGRYTDRNRRYDQQGTRQGVGNYGPSQNYQEQNSIPPRQGENRGPMPGHTPGGRDTQGNYYPQEQRNFPQGGQRNYAPPGQGEFRRDERNYGPPHSEAPGQGLDRNQGQGAAQSLGQWPSTRAYGQPSSTAYGQGPSSGNFGQGPSSGAYGQGSSSGAYGQEPSSGNFGQGPSSGAYGQGPSSVAYGQGPSSGNYGPGPKSGLYGQQPNSGAPSQGTGSGPFGQGPSSAFGQGPSPGAYGQGPISGAYGQQGEQRKMQDVETNYAPMGQTGSGQGRY